MDLIISSLFFFRRYLTRELIGHSQSSTRSQRCYLLFENFENLERASVSLLMVSAKQGNYWYHCLRLEHLPDRQSIDYSVCTLNNEPTQYVLPLDSLNGMFMVLYVFLYDKLHCLKVVILILR